MKAKLWVATLSLTGSLLAQTLPSYVYHPEEIRTLLSTEFTQFKNPACLKDYLKSEDYRARLASGGYIREIEIANSGRTQRFNIRYNQMGGAPGNMTSINTIIHCDLKRF